MHCSPGSWLLDPLAAQTSTPSILQTLVENRAGRRPRRFRNMTIMGTPTAKLDSRHGNISAAFRVVGESAMPAIATIRSSTRSGNIVLELVSQSATCQCYLRLTSRVQVSKSPTRVVHFDASSRTGKSKTRLSIDVFGHPKSGLCLRPAERHPYHQQILNKQQ